MIKLSIYYALWLLGIKKILPREFISRVVVEETNEPLILLKETAHIKIGPHCFGCLLRKKVAERLVLAANNLPSGYVIVLMEGFRPLKRQKELWDIEFKKIKEQNPNLSQAELERRTRLFVASPKNGAGGHQTGAAIDITLGDENGRELFLGTKIHEFSPKTKTASKNVTLQEKKLRKILLNSMSAAGFVNYPGEWWHFSYGDRLWAAYKKKKKCPYGPVTG